MTHVACPATADSAPSAPRVRDGVRRRFRPWRAALAIALPALIAGCYHSNNGGNYYPYQLVEVSYGVAATDLNGDGFADVVQLSTVQPIQTANSSNLKTYLSTGAGAFAAPALTTAGTDPLYVVAADVNGDGFADLVTASYDDGTISVFLNNAASPGSFSAPLVLPSQGASQLAIADMTGDGLPDIVSADFNVSLFVQTAAGAFAAPVQLYPGGANWVAVGDLNGDGAPDVVLTDAAGVKLLLHTGAPSDTTFAAPVSVFTQTPNANLAGANIMAIADVDGDGRNDLVLTDPGPTGGMAATVNVLLQDPANPGGFLTPVAYPIATQDVPQSIRLVDLQGSGRLDIVIGERHDVTVLLHDPASPGSFLPANVYPAEDANEIAIADVDGDGRPDIVVSNGVTQPLVNGVYTTQPGVLLQSATTSGAFGALQDLP
jgi:hypothetical protein